MTEERQVRPGWLPPRAPGSGPPPRFEADPPASASPAPPASPPPAPPASPPPAPPAGWSPPAPDRGYGQPIEPPPTRPQFVTRRDQPPGPSSPLAVTGIAVGAVAILLLVFSLGVGFFLCGVLAAIALLLAAIERRRLRAGRPGRPGQVRAAVILASVALGLALVAAITWTALDASGFSPEDLQEWLEDQIERPRDEGPRGGDPA